MPDKLRSLDNLVADLTFGAYWHDEFYRVLPQELVSWGLALSGEDACHG